MSLGSEVRLGQRGRKDGGGTKDDSNDILYCKKIFMNYVTSSLRYYMIFYALFIMPILFTIYKKCNLNKSL